MAKDKSIFMRGLYEKFSADQKVAIGKQAAEHGISATMLRTFSKIYPDHPLKECTVRG